MEININIDKKSLREYFEENYTLSPSFISSLKLLWNEIRLKKNQYPTFILDSKLVGYSFARILGLQTPSIYQVNVSIDEVLFRDNMVLKPVNEDSSKGVMVIGEGEHVRCLFSGRKFVGFETARQYGKNLLSVGRVKSNKWMVEELIRGNTIAQDLKFYCFYGQVGLVLESQRIPELKRCWYDNELNIVNTGRYEDLLFEGSAKKDLQGLLELASEISLEIPAPFVRIDFLKQGENVYLGEFTPIPGGYQNFNLEWDMKLGESYQRATTRIMLDIAKNKKFSKFQQLIGEI